MTTGRVVQVNVSAQGGVPKPSVESAEVRTSGIEGDGQAKPDIHGGPERAVSLFSLEHIEALQAEGHPIAPGSIGENLTLSGLDWATLEPGVRLRVGSEVELEISSYASPCRSIAGSFSDGRFGRLLQVRNPGWSRLYCRVLREGTVRPGDAVETRTAEARAGEAPAANVAAHTVRPTVGYVNVYVTDLERSIEFFQVGLGLELQFGDPKFGYASFDAGPVRMGLAAIDARDPDQRAMIGRQTGIGFVVEDLVSAHRRLEARGVEFREKPAKQPWGGFMALFCDPDGNVFYLDQPDAP